VFRAIVVLFVAQFAFLSFVRAHFYRGDEKINPPDGGPVCSSVNLEIDADGKGVTAGVHSNYSAKVYGCFSATKQAVSKCGDAQKKYQDEDTKLTAEYQAKAKAAAVDKESGVQAVISEALNVNQKKSNELNIANLACDTAIKAIESSFRPPDDPTAGACSSHGLGLPNDQYGPTEADLVKAKVALYDITCSGKARIAQTRNKLKDARIALLNERTQVQKVKDSLLTGGMIVAGGGLALWGIIRTADHYADKSERRQEEANYARGIIKVDGKNVNCIDMRQLNNDQ